MRGPRARIFRQASAMRGTSGAASHIRLFECEFASQFEDVLRRRSANELCIAFPLQLLCQEKKVFPLNHGTKYAEEGISI
jgi:hypothetical protein